jgi:hypothetical protein
MADLLAAFLEHTESDDPKLAKQLSRVAGEPALAEVLARFDSRRAGELDERDREMARRVLALLHRPSGRGLELLAGVLSYLDVGGDQALGYPDLALGVEILELFCKADSVNDTLSNKELEILQAVLGYLDTDGNGVLDRDERTRLRDQLWDPEAFLADQKENNPLVRELLR